MKEIKLTQGKVALVDDEDFDELNKYKWCAVKDRTTFYAMRKPSQKNPARSMHRTIMNTPKGMQVDHINHNGLDNQKHNLRNCTGAENTSNYKIPITNTSGYKGVYLQCDRRGERIYKYWKAQISEQGKQKAIGNFKTPELAALAYNQKAKELFGEFAYLNKVEGSYER